MTNPFTYDEREILNGSLSAALEEVGPYGDPDLEVGSMQESYTWKECFTLLSILENSSCSPYQGRGDKDDLLDWYKLHSKIQGMAFDELKDYRIQSYPTKGCGGYLIFFSGAGKVPVTSLIPDRLLERISHSFSEDMFGFIIATCPKCNHIQLYGIAKGNEHTQEVGR